MCNLPQFLFIRPQRAEKLSVACTLSARCGADVLKFRAVQVYFCHARNIPQRGEFFGSVNGSGKIHIDIFAGQEGEKSKFENKVPGPTVRNMLAGVALRAAKTEAERAALTEYKLNLETVNDMQTERNCGFSKLLSMLPKSGYSAFTAEEIEAQQKLYR